MEKVFLYIILLILLILFLLKLRYHTYNHKIDVCILDCGEKHLQNSSIVFCGLIKNASENIDNAKRNIYSVVKKCKRYKVILLENDSKDNTREKLLQWVSEDINVVVLGCGVNVKKCSINDIKNVNDKDYGKRRIDKMIYLRNIYLRYIYENYSDYDYTIVYDYDLKLVCYKDGLYKAFYNLYTDNSINVLSPYAFKYFNFWLYEWYRLLDSYAFVKENPQDKDDYLDDSKKRTYCDKIAKKGKLFKVTSSFGAMNIYRMSALLQKYYRTYEIGDKAVCEHVCLHMDIGNVYVDPLFQCHVISNTS